MTRNIKFSVGEFYHLYNRGNDKRKIFFDDNDYRRFLILLFLCNSTKSIVVREILREKDIFNYDRGDCVVDIGAWCIMSNHFHILVHEKIEGGISNFMHKLSTAYSMYFNKKYDRSGSLYEGNFKARHANKDEYLKYLFSYIHLNPVEIVEKKWKEVGIKNLKFVKKFLNEYKYSSYSDYTDCNRPHKNILNKESFPEYFVDVKDFDKNIEEWIEFPATLL